jgi:phosphatidylinositol alpha-1,6-mannosyltransferase
MNVLLLTDNFPPRAGGSCRWFWELYRRLQLESVFIVAGEGRGAQAFDKRQHLQIQRLPMTFKTWGLINPSSASTYVRLARAVGRLARDRGTDIVHCGRCLPEGLIGFWLKASTGMPYVCFVHGEELTYAAMSRELGWLMRRVYRNASIIIANSRNTLETLGAEWGLDRDRLRLLNPGVDTSWFIPADQDPDLRSSLGWGDRSVVLTVGRLQRRKGHDVMIKAMPDVLRIVPDAFYAIVGDGECEPDLRDLVASMGLGEYVRFHGAIDDWAMRQCYQQSDLFVLPNRQDGLDIEGFGIVLLEAQACGKAVVAGASGGTAETMDAPRTGLVVPCEAPGALAKVVADLLMDSERRGRMGRAGRDWMVERFDWDVLSRRAERIFRGKDPDRLDHDLEFIRSSGP